MIFAAVEAEIRKVLPQDRIDLILDNIGLPNGGINLAFGNNATISNSDGDILISLKPGKRETLEFTRQLRQDLNAKFPTLTFFFTPANITNQILDFGLPAPIDLQVVGRNPTVNFQIAQDLLKRVMAIPGAVDVHIHQQVTYPTLQVNVDRIKAEQMGFQQRDVANSMLISLSGSGQTAPNQWLNPQNGVNYQVVAQTPTYRINSFEALGRTPVTATNGANSQLLANLATMKRDVSAIVIDHYNIQPTYDIYADVDQRQLRLASVTWDRYKVLVAKGVLSKQEGDTQEANFRVAEANVQAADNSVQANRDNLERNIVLQQYERVTAPFSGVITDRNVDVGALITASGSGLGNGASTTTPGASQSGVRGNNQGTSGNVSSSVNPSTGGAQGGEMFQIASVDRLRIVVSVPEAYSDQIHVGQRAKLVFQERPNDQYEGRVTRTSASIDQNTRTLLVEVQVGNSNRKLLPGMYVVVNFIEVKAHPPLLIPGESIVVRGGQTMVARVEEDVIRYVPVTIGRDYGDESEIPRGLQQGDVIVTTITDQVRDGAKVDPQFQKQSAPPTAGAQTIRGVGQSGQYGPQGQANKTQGPGKGGASK